MKATATAMASTSRKRNGGSSDNSFRTITSRYISPQSIQGLRGDCFATQCCCLDPSSAAPISIPHKDNITASAVQLVWGCPRLSHGFLRSARVFHNHVAPRLRGCNLLSPTHISALILSLGATEWRCRGQPLPRERSPSGATESGVHAAFPSQTELRSCDVVRTTLPQHPCLHLIPYKTKES